MVKGIRELGDEDWEDAKHVASYFKFANFYSAEDAARHYAEIIWQNDPRDVDYFSTEVEVLEDDDTIKTFYCTAETNINFRATEMTSDD